MFPLSSVLFPHAPLRLHVFEPRYRQLVADCLAGDREMGVVLITRGSEVGGQDRRAGVGTVARIEDTMPMPDGRWFLLLGGQRRVTIAEWLLDDPYPRALVADLPDDAGTGDDSEPPGTSGPYDHEQLDEPPPTVLEAFSAVRQTWGLLSEAGKAPALPVQPGDLASQPVVASWQLCQLAPVGPLDRQRLLETPTMARRLELVTQLSRELSDDLRRMLAGG